MTQAIHIPYYQMLQARTLKFYSLLCLLVSGVLALSHSHTLDAMGITSVFPGGGFLITGNALAFLLCLSSLCLAFILWFATGNILAIIIVYLATIVSSGLSVSEADIQYVDAFLLSICISAVSIVWLCFFKLTTVNAKRSILIDATPDAYNKPVYSPNLQPPTNKPPLLSLNDMKRVRLLLDRALQPINEFSGFEKRDQFQTAATRYQINSISYGLSAIQYAHTPAFSGYMSQAQKQLLSKLCLPSIWRYWQWENRWGNINNSSDPIARDNIMYSGFLSTQALLANGAGPVVITDTHSPLVHLSDQQSYCLEAIIVCLAQQYKQARMGLIACEPNWIYPLCNTVTVCGIKGFDHHYGTQFWSEIKAIFMRGLNDNFFDKKGRMLAFRSSHTGWTPGAIGGLAMQASPCLFLNTIDSKFAQNYWQRLNYYLDETSVKKSCWPIDAGNYQFSRASSYIVSASAAREMGDQAMVNKLLAHLNSEYPLVAEQGVVHRENASLLAHGYEMIARYGQNGGIKHIMAMPTPKHQPHLSYVNYPEVLVASAHYSEPALSCTLYWVSGSAQQVLIFDAMMPNTYYTVSGDMNITVISNHSGRIRFTCSLKAVMNLTITPQKRH